MNELYKLYEAWCRENTIDTPDIREKYSEILEYLYENCSDTIREEISTFILDFSHLAEKQAFIAGYRQAFLLWFNILNTIE